MTKLYYFHPERARRGAAFAAVLLAGLLAAPAASAQQTDSPTYTRAYPPAERLTAPVSLLRSGPMVTHSAMREAGLWVQLTRPGGVQIEYWIKGNPKRRWRTPVVLTAGPDHLAELVADSVEPGRKYSYRLWAATMEEERLRVLPRPYPLEFQTQTLWQWRADPPDFRVAFGSGTYVRDSLYDRPDQAFGSQYGVFSAINHHQPDVMVWLGDNTYLREADWDSPSGFRRRYAHTRALPAMQALLGSVHNYAIWDDHDYGPNDADRTFALREAALTTFKSYWPNPAYRPERGPAGGGITSTFQWSDVQFFLLDDRWFRSPNHDDAAHGQLLGPEQIKWLTEALVTSKATFKVVCMGGQVLNPAKVYETYANYDTERAELLRRLANTRVPGVVFVSGDRHHAELTRLDRPGLYPLYELTTSPLTGAAIPAGHAEANTLREAGTFTAERNFALFDVAGAPQSRTLTMTLCNAEGRPLWKRALRATDLQPGATPVAAAETEAAPEPPGTGTDTDATPATPGRLKPAARPVPVREMRATPRPRRLRSAGRPVPPLSVAQSVQPLPLPLHRP